MNSYRRERLIEIAKSLQNFRTGRSLHCAFILNKNQLLVSSVNSYRKLHPYHRFGVYKPLKENAEFYKSGVHAEISALSQYTNKFGNSDFSGLTIFVVRLSKNGEEMLSKPCGNCQRVLDSFNFKAILWT